MKEKTRREVEQHQAEKEQFLHQIQQLKGENNNLRTLILSSIIQTCENRAACVLSQFIHGILLRWSSYAGAPDNDNTLNLMRCRNQKHDCISNTNTIYCSLRRLSKSLLAEIDKIREDDGILVSSTLLHSTPQLFQKEALMVDLNRKLTAVIFEIIKDDERVHPITENSIHSSDQDSLCDSFDSEHEGEQKSNPDTYLLSDNNNMVVDGDKNVHTYCKACNSVSCCWKSSIRYFHKVKRRENLSKLILLNMKQRSQPSFNDNTGVRTNFTYYEDLTQEADLIDDECKLYEVDMELHNAFNKTKEKHIVVRSLHNYEVMMNTNHAIIALGKEQERLVAKLAATEIIHNVLEWMDNGWYFEPRGDTADCSRLSLMNLHEQQCIVQQDQEGLIQKICLKSCKKKIQKDIYGRTNQRVGIFSATEKSIKIFALCLTLRYFNTCRFCRGLASSAQSCSVVVLEEDSTSATKQVIVSASRITKNMTTEEQHEYNMTGKQGKKMKRSSSNFTTNITGSRGFLDRRSHGGNVSSKKELLLERNTSKHDCHNIRQIASSLVIQKYYRGHIGRKAVLLWRNHYESNQVWRALCHSCAVTITRHWRGYSSRKMAASYREQMVEYLFTLRKDEAKEDEDVFLNMMKATTQRRYFLSYSSAEG